MARHAHLFGVHDLSRVVKCGADQHAVSIKSESELGFDAIAKYNRGLEHQLVMTDKPRRCPEIGQEPQSASGGHRVRHQASSNTQTGTLPSPSTNDVV